MKINNPYQTLPFEKVTNDKQGQQEYGFRTVDGLEEVVHIPSGKSNMNYYVPEKVLNPEGCNHVFNVINIGLREIECGGCKLTTSFHPTSLKESDGKIMVVINKREYEIQR